MTGIGELAQGFFTGEALWDTEEHRFDTTRDQVQVSHLNAVCGLVEMVTELLDLIDAPDFERAWHDYCRLYLASSAEQAEVFGAPLTGISLVPAHSRLLAIVASHERDAAAARRAWDAFFLGLGDQLNVNSLIAEAEEERTRVRGPVRSEEHTSELQSR